MKLLASNIIEKYGTNNPYELCKLAGVLIVQEPLGNIHGYYNKVGGQKFIHVNDKLPEYFQGYVVAHMLYRVFTNPDEMLFLKRKSSQSFTEAESRANAFALNLSRYNDESDLDVHEFLYMCGLSERDTDDLFVRLYRAWDPKKTMNRDALFKYVISQMR